MLFEHCDPETRLRGPTMADVVRMTRESSEARAMHARFEGQSHHDRGVEHTFQERARIAGTAGRGWPPERDAALMQLWADRGLSAAEIGRRLGISKNAVVGRSHRLRLPARPSPIIRNGDKPRVRRPRPPRETLPLQEMAPIREPLPLLHQTPEPIITADKARGLCCWPIGHPGTSDFAFCGNASRPGKPYCNEHCQRAYVARATGCADRADP